MKYVLIPLCDSVDMRKFIKNCDPACRTIRARLQYISSTGHLTYYAVEAELTEEDLVAFALLFSGNSSKFKLLKDYTFLYEVSKSFVWEEAQ